MTFLGLHLETCNLRGFSDFYVNRLQLSYIEESAGSFAVQVGETKLGFEKVDQEVQPIYYFTIGILETNFAEVINRLSSHIHLLKSQRQTIPNTATGAVQPVYTYDPVGNIIEFVPQASADNVNTWGITQIGMPVDDPGVASDYLLEHLELPLDSRKVMGETVLVGDSTYSFLFVKRGSNWFPGENPAEIHRIGATVPATIYAEIKVLDHPYYVNRATV